MIILQGPDDQLRRQLLDKLVLMNSNLQPQFTKEPYRADPAFLTWLVQTDHREVVRDQLLHHLGDGNPLRYMLGMALAAAGSVVVICGHLNRDEMRAATFDGLLLVVPAIGRDVDVSVKNILEASQLEQQRIRPTYDFLSSGGRPANATMLVGEANLPDHGRRRRAFIKQDGCSLYLHDALQRNPHQRYYLTNADKGLGSYNRNAMREEIELVQPARIVAMGANAQAALSSLGVRYEHTYHPQYWKRFKNDRLQELADFLK